MTVHSAKGLEFPIVFIAGMEDGIFPSQMTLEEPGGINEERRLAYVAITRAKDKLYISHTKGRTMYGRTTYNPLSVFIREELPESLIENDTPQRPSPYSQPYMGNTYNRSAEWQRKSYADEVSRRPAVANTQNKPRANAQSFGVEKLSVGTRVRHALFGTGVIVSARDMGGDVLYEVRFDTAGTKRLMATYAKLERIDK